jgi:hypothetical protein
MGENHECPNWKRAGEGNFGRDTIRIKWDGDGFYIGDGWGEGISRALYCPYCGAKLDESEKGE